MSDLPRRQALLAAASGIAALAGCADEDDGPTMEHERDDRPIEDYEVRHVRNEEGAVLFSQGEALPTPTGDEQGRRVRSGRGVIVSEDQIGDFTFGDVSEAEQLRAFATATDFDSSSLYLFAMPVDACYEMQLQSVTIEWDDLDTGDLHPHVDFCRTYRPADVECGADESHTIGFAIRLPTAAERSSGSGRGMSRSCESSPRGTYFDGNVTPVNGGKDE